MLNFHHKQNLHKLNKKQQRVRFVIEVLMVLIVILLSGGAVYLYTESNKDVVKPVANNIEYKEEFSGSLKKTISSDKFDFISSLDWKLSQDDSDLPNKYVYYSYQSGLVKDRLAIYFDGGQKSEGLTYLLTTTQQNFAKIISSELSPRCGSKNVARQTVVFNSISYICLGEVEKVIIGASDQSSANYVELKNGDGQIVRLGFIYQDLSSENPRDYKANEISTFSDVLGSFRLK